VSPRNWQERVRDIVDAIVEIGTFLNGIDFEQFQKDARTVKAVTADLAIIGEAAGHIPKDIADASPAIPWALMKGMRHHLVHGYFHVDLQIVWETCQNDLPRLLDPLNEMLRNNPLSP
jgi:uncharacterized protein with HEPN domain